MAGTINLALTQQFDMDGNPLSGGLLYFFAASTTTPQTAFQDIALTIPHPNPIVLDASGRVPMFYVADGNIKIRLANKAGVTVIAADNLLVIGPSTGGGGGGGVDPTTVAATGDIKARFGTGPLGGFVRCNGNTIGNAVSGSTERANADCQALFEYLWSTTVLGVFSGVTPNRGSTANADWLANKRIALPDLRGRMLAGMDDMGATAANRLTTTYFGASGIVLGNAGGSENQTLTAAQLPGHTHTGSGVTGSENQLHAHTVSGTTGFNNETLDHTHPFTDFTFGASTGTAPGGNPPGGSQTTIANNTGTSSIGVGAHTHAFGGTTTTESAAHTHNFGLTTNAGDGLTGSPHTSVSPTMVVTIYIKL